MISSRHVAACSLSWLLSKLITFKYNILFSDSANSLMPAVCSLLFPKQRVSRNLLLLSTDAKSLAASSVISLLFNCRSIKLEWCLIPLHSSLIPDVLSLLLFNHNSFNPGL